MRRAVLAAFVAAYAAAAAIAQAPGPAPAGTARLAGRVIAADTGRPLRAQLQLVPAAGGAVARYAWAGADGRFAFTDLPAGRYRLTARREGYVTLEFGQRQPPEPGRPIELADPGAFEAADFALPRTSAIEGRVVDEFGDAAPGVEVQIARVDFVAGRRRLMPVSSPSGTRPTDDRGAFRIFGLSPGDYYVLALSGPFSTEGGGAAFAPTFHPGTTVPTDAIPVRVDVGRDATGLVFALTTAETATVSGIAVDEAGQPAPGATVLLLQLHGGDVRAMVMARAPSGPDGAFTFRGVPRGPYAIQAMAPRGFGSLAVTVDGPVVEGLRVAITDGGAMRGRILFEDAGSLPPPARVRVFSRPIDFVHGPVIGRGLPPQQTREDWTFEVTGLFGIGVIGVDAPAPWGLARVGRQGEDLTDRPVDFRAGNVDEVEVVLTSRLAALRGRVVGDDGRAVEDYSVVVFADEPARWTFPSRYIALGRPNQQGEFLASALPPAVYLAVALPAVQGTEWQDPEFLAIVRPLATRVTLSAGETRAIDLRLMRRR